MNYRHTVLTLVLTSAISFAFAGGPDSFPLQPLADKPGLITIKGQRGKVLRIKGKSIAFDDAFLGGYSTWARTRDLRINRNPDSSKTIINQ
jgi:hypothetical protein